MAAPDTYPEHIMDACVQIWDFYEALGLDPMDDGTYDRNDFAQFLLTMGRLLDVFKQYSPRERHAIAAAFITLAVFEPNEYDRDLAFERVMDALVARSLADEEP